MKIPLSKLELAAIGLMVLGIALGCYGGVALERGMSRAIDGLHFGEGVLESASIRRVVGPTKRALSEAHRGRLYEAIGVWTFLSGIGLFVVGGRLRLRAYVTEIGRASAPPQASESSAERPAPAGAGEQQAEEDEWAELS